MIMEQHDWGNIECGVYIYEMVIYERFVVEY